MSFCAYYQATVERKRGWFFVGILRSFEHLCFDRTLDVETSRFEFFVPIEQEAAFVEIMKMFEEKGVISGLAKLPNRFQ